MTNLYIPEDRTLVIDHDSGQRFSFFTPQTKIVTIDDEHSVTLRKLTHGEKQEIIEAGLKHHTGGEMAMGNAVLSLTLYKMLIAWHGPGFEGRPVTKENIDALPAEVTDLITQAINDFGTLASAEKKRSNATTNSA